MGRCGRAADHQDGTVLLPLGTDQGLVKHIIFLERYAKSWTMAGPSSSLSTQHVPTQLPLEH